MKSILTFLLCLAMTPMHAQDFTFKVLVSKGTNEVKSGEEWQALRVGESLKEDDEIRVVENSYLGLIHVTGKPCEVKLPGNYSVAKLASNVGKGSSVVNKYTDFILSSTVEKRNKLSATGAVHRSDRAPITLFLPGPGSDYAYADEIVITWEDEKNLAPYRVVLSNLYGDELLAINTEITSCRVNLDEGLLAKEETVLVTVNSQHHRNRSSNQRSIKKLSGELRSHVETTLDEMETAIADTTALNMLVLGGFFEERGLIVDALSAYFQASLLAPEVTDFTMAYLEFLDRLNMKEPESKDQR